MLFGHEVQGHRNRSRRNPEMDMGTVCALFVYIHFDNAFVEGVDAGDDDGAGKGERAFSKD
jgi:hypothetical protein